MYVSTIFFLPFTPITQVVRVGWSAEQPGKMRKVCGTAKFHLTLPVELPKLVVM